MDVLHMGLSNAVTATVLAVLAAACGRLGRRPALAHALWLLVLVKLITPSFVIYRIPWPEEAQPAKVMALARPIEPDAPARTILASASDSVDIPPVAAHVWSEPVESEPTVNNAEEPTAIVAGDVDPAPARTPARSLFPILTGIWLAGLIGWFILVAYRIACFRRWFACARPASPELRAQAEQLAKRLGLAACPSLWLLPGRLSPMVWALGHRPHLLVPSALWARLDAEQQAALLIHELAHVRRRDYWVRRLELLVTGLYWWHPVVWWACREIHEAEEQCCDAWVVSILPGAARAYAIALMETVDFLSETQPALPAVASGIGRVHDLRRRLTMIMHGKTPRALSEAGFWVVLGMGALLPLMPTWAQGPGESPVAPAAEEQQPVIGRDVAVPVQSGDSISEQEQLAEPSRPEDADERRERDLSQKDVDHLRQEVERMKIQFERAVKRLEAAERRLARSQDLNSRPAPQVFAKPAPTPAVPGPRRERPADAERRLSELERKLDALFNEVQSLRREMRRSGPGMMPGQPPMTTPAPGGRRLGERYPRMPGAAPTAPALPPAPGRPVAPLPPTAAPTPAALPTAPSLAPPETLNPTPAPEPSDAVRRR